MSVYFGFKGNYFFHFMKLIRFIFKNSNQCHLREKSAFCPISLKVLRKSSNCNNGFHKETQKVNYYKRTSLCATRLNFVWIRFLSVRLALFLCEWGFFLCDSLELCVSSFPVSVYQFVSMRSKLTLFVCVMRLWATVVLCWFPVTLGLSHDHTWFLFKMAFNVAFYNVIVLGLCFMFVFTAFQTSSNVQVRSISLFLLSIPFVAQSHCGSRKVE